MGQVIPIKTGKRVRTERRARKFAAVCERATPALAGAARLIGRLLRDTAWMLACGSLRLFGRYIRFGLTLVVLAGLVVLGVEYAHHWPHPRNAIITGLVIIALLGLREALIRLERRALF